MCQSPVARCTLTNLDDHTCLIKVSLIRRARDSYRKCLGEREGNRGAQLSPSGAKGEGGLARLVVGNVRLPSGQARGNPSYPYSWHALPSRPVQTPSTPVYSWLIASSLIDVGGSGRKSGSGEASHRKPQHTFFPSIFFPCCFSSLPDMNGGKMLMYDNTY